MRKRRASASARKLLPGLVHLYTLSMTEALSAFHGSGDLSRRAVQRLRESLFAGSFGSLVAIDPATGEILDADARALLASLPAVTPATAPDELVSQGLLVKTPRNLRRVFDRPKYFAGRPVFIKTTVTHVATDRDQPVGRFDPEGPVEFTHLARLVRREENAFLVEVEGAPDFIRVEQAELFAWNEPSGVAPQGGTLSGVDIDYNDPLFKAHVCAAYLELADAIAELDYDAPDSELADRQRALVYRVASKVRCDFVGQGEGYRGARAGALLAHGQGVSFTQRAVAVGFLQAFSRVLSFDVQAAVGRTLRLAVPHGFAVVTLRPSALRYVCDPAWREPLTDLPVAFFGPGWGHDRRLVAFEGEQQVTVRPEEVDLP